MEKKTGYLSSAWGELTEAKGWWHTVVIMALAKLIPIVGNIFVTGYMLDWAREGAWGMKRGLPREMGDLGKRGKWGLYSIVITFVWYLPFSVVAALLEAGGPLLSLLSLIVSILGFVALLLATAAAVYAVIYDKLAAGFQVKKIWKMACMNPGGVAACFLIALLEIVVWCVALAVMFLIAAPVIMGIIGMLAPVFASEFGGTIAPQTFGYVGTGAGAVVLFGGAAFILIIIVAFVADVFSTAIEALYYRAFGYWLGQFKTAEWGGYKEPLPFENEGMSRNNTSAAENEPPASPKPDEEPAVQEAPVSPEADEPIEVEAQVEDAADVPAEEAESKPEPEAEDEVEEEAEVEAAAEVETAAETEAEPEAGTAAEGEAEEGAPKDSQEG